MKTWISREAKIDMVFCGAAIAVLAMLTLATSCVQIGSGTLNARMTMWRSIDAGGNTNRVDTSMTGGGTATADIPITEATP